MRTRDVLVFTLVLALLAAHPSFAARSDAEIQTDIQNLLMLRHPTETSDWWRALGPNAVPIIIQMYQATDKPYWKQRLLQGLGWFGEDSRAVDFLKEQAGTDDEVNRNTAIRSIGHSGAAEEDFIAEFLKHADPQTRIAAAETLKKIGDAHAVDLVNRYLAQEKTPWVASKVQGVLPTPTASAVPVSSSEDALSPELVGSWHGYRIMPKAGDSGMESQPAQASFEISDATRLTGKLLIRVKAGRVLAEHLKASVGRASKFKGFLVQDNAPQLSDELAFEGTIELQNGSFLVELRVPKTGAVIVLRRDPR